jgi:hypothetical protein
MKPILGFCLILICTFVTISLSEDVYEAVCTFDGYLYPGNAAAPETDGQINFLASGVCDFSWRDTKPSGYY